MVRKLHIKPKKSDLQKFLDKQLENDIFRKIWEDRALLRKFRSIIFSTMINKKLTYDDIIRNSGLTRTVVDKFFVENGEIKLKNALILMEYLGLELTVKEND